MASFGSAHSATVNYATPLKQEINYFQIQFTSKLYYNLTISNYNQIIIKKIKKSPIHKLSYYLTGLMSVKCDMRE